MERATIIVDGLVQGVGFRYKVRAGAVSLGVTGYVKNLDDETVEIVAEGSKQDIESLIQKMRNFGEPVVVKGIKVSRQKATGEFRSFRIVVGDMLAEMVEGFDTGNMHFEISHRKQDQMLDKQDQMIATIQGYSEKMLDKQDQTSAEVRHLSDNLGNMMDRRFQRLEGEIRLITESGGAYFRSWFSRRPRSLECDLGPATIEITTRNAAGRDGGGAGREPHAGRAAQQPSALA